EISLTVRPDATLTINCKVSYSVTSEDTGWIHQPAGKALEWIGLIDSAGNLAYKDSLKNKFSITRDTSSNTITLMVYLKLSGLTAEDSAVYYCARDSHDLRCTRVNTVITTSSSSLKHLE
uniref:Ig-like domain-containing protein n=1 Tax=Sinocyclocheilus anshuiensis TaxID=1608454 RepID=A0A671QCH2_9TELE